MHADTTRYEAQLSILCCQELPLVNDCDLLAEFSDFYLPLSYLTPSVRLITSSYQVHI